MNLSLILSPKRWHLNRYEQFLHAEFLAELESNPDLGKLISKINDRVQIFVFGGWCRDKIHSCRYGESVASSDIDIVVNGELEESVLGNFHRTQFGGFRLHLKSAEKLVDFWPLSQTFAFVKGLFAPTIDNLLKSTIFDVNSILFDIGSSRVINGLALEAIENRQLGFNCMQYLDFFADLQAYRALYIAHKLNYCLREDVLSFVVNLLRGRSFEEFANNVQKYRTHVSREIIQKLYTDFLVSTSTVRG